MKTIQLLHQAAELFPKGADINVNGFAVQNRVDQLLRWDIKPVYGFTLVFMKRHIQHLIDAGFKINFSSFKQIKVGSNTNTHTCYATASIDVLLKCKKWARPNHETTFNMEIMHEWDKTRIVEADFNNFEAHKERILQIKKQIRRFVQNNKIDLPLVREAMNSRSIF